MADCEVTTIERIPLRNRKGETVAYAIVDKQDAPKVEGFRWHMNACGYAVRATSRKQDPEGKQRPIFMHREIFDVPSGMEVDHISGDKLDNRRVNMRPCTHAQNCRNRKRRSDSSSQFKGVTSSGSRTNPWRAQIQINGALKYLGTFATAEEAARVYDEAARSHYGSFARTNF